MASRASQEDIDFGLEREGAAAQALVDKLWPGALLVKHTTFAHIDFGVVLDGKLVAYIEVKRRRVEHNKYDSAAVSKNKYDAARALKAIFKVPTLCLCVYTDRVGYFSLHERPDTTTFLGRPDRGGAGCTHAFYNLSRFTWL